MKLPERLYLTLSQGFLLLSWVDTPAEPQRVPQEKKRRRFAAAIYSNFGEVICFILHNDECTVR